MKKLFKTLLAVMVAIVMCFAVVALSGAGCKENVEEVVGGTDGGTNPVNPNDKNDGGDKNKPENPSGNTPPQDENPDINPENPPSPEKPALEIPELQLGKYATLLTTEYAALGVEGGMTPAGGMPMTFNANVNLDGNADINMESPGEHGETVYRYAFMRDWGVYIALGDAEATDFSEAQLEGVVDINEAISYMLAMSGQELPEELVSAFDLSNGVSTPLTAVNYLILNIAEAAGTIIEREISENDEEDVKKVIEMNVTQTLYTMASEITAVVGALEETTTIGEILGNETVEKYLKIFTELVTPEDGVAFIKNAIEIAKADPEIATAQKKIMEAVSVFLDKFPPEAGSSTYDYIVRVLTALNLKELTIGDVISLIETEEEITLQDIKDTVAGYLGMFGEDGITLPQFAINELVTIYVCSKDNKLEMQVIEVSVQYEENDFALGAAITYLPDAFGDLAELPEELPEIPEFDPDDFFPETGKVKNLDGTIYLDQKTGNFLAFYQGEFAINSEKGQPVTSGYYEQNGEEIIFAQTLEDLKNETNLEYAYQSEGGGKITFNNAAGSVYNYYGDLGQGGNQEGPGDDPPKAVITVKNTVWESSQSLATVEFGESTYTLSININKYNGWYVQDMENIYIYLTEADYKSGNHSEIAVLEPGIRLVWGGSGIVFDSFDGNEKPDHGDEPDNPGYTGDIGGAIFVNGDYTVIFDYDKTVEATRTSDGSHANTLYYRQQSYSMIDIYATVYDYENYIVGATWNISGQEMTTGEFGGLIYSGRADYSSQAAMAVNGKVFKHISQGEVYLMLDYDYVWIEYNFNEDSPEGNISGRGTYSQNNDSVILTEENGNVINITVVDKALIRNSNEEDVFVYICDAEDFIQEEDPVLSVAGTRWRAIGDTGATMTFRFGTDGTFTMTIEYKGQIVQQENGWYRQNDTVVNIYLTADQLDKDISAGTLRLVEEQLIYGEEAMDLY